MLKVARSKGEPGDIVEFGDVLVVGGDTSRSARPMVAGASVAAEVLEQGRGPKVIAFKKRRRKNSRRKRGHRQEFTLIRITEILTDGDKPSKASAAAAEARAEARGRRPKRPKPAPKAPRRKASAKAPKAKAKADGESGSAKGKKK